MGQNPEHETKIEAFLFREMPLDERANFERELASDADLQADLEARKAQAHLMRRAFLREKVRQSKAEFGALDLPVEQAEPARTVSLFQNRWAMAAGLALALGGAAWWMWSQGEKTASEIAQTRQKTEALQKDLAEKEAQKAAENSQIEPFSTEKAQPEPPVDSKKDQKPLAQNEPKKGKDLALDPVLYSSEKPNFRGDEAIKKGKGNAIFQSLDAKIDLEKARAAQPALVKKIEQKRFSEVLTALEKAELADKNAGFYLAAVCYFEQGAFSKCITELDSIYFKNNPFYADAKWLMALCRLREEKLEAAKQLFTEISNLKNHPQQAKAAAALNKF